METPDVPEAAPTPEPIVDEDAVVEPLVPTDDVVLPLEEDEGEVPPDS